MTDDGAASAPTDFEVQKWQVEIELRRQALALEERKEVRLAAEAARSRWWNPLVIAIIGATITALGSIAVSWWNGRVSEQTETLKAESARIVQMLGASNIEKAKENLHFLAETGLITGTTKENVERYLKTVPEGQGPLVSLGSIAQPASAGIEASVYSIYQCHSDTYYLYQYTARAAGGPAFRVVLYPDWGHPVGGHDLTTRDEAEKIINDACAAKP